MGIRAVRHAFEQLYQFGPQAIAPRSRKVMKS